jgi:DNA-binding CsgD family transcriptional regulator
MLNEIYSLRDGGSNGRLHLSPRQEQILALIASGKSDSEIAARLGISSRTVGSHLQRVYQAHGLHTRAAAVAAWLRR